MKMPSKLVGIQNQSFSAVIRGGANRNIQLEENDWVQLIRVSYQKDDAKLDLQARGL